MLNKIIHKLVFTCQKATLLMELKEGKEISFFQNIRLQLHLLICNYCRIYKKKKLFISQFFEKNKSGNPKKEIEDSKIEELKNKINQHINNLNSK